MSPPKLKDLTSKKYVDDRIAEIIESAVTRKELREVEKRLQGGLDVHSEEFAHIETALSQITSDLNGIGIEKSNEPKKAETKQTLRERFTRITGLSSRAG